MPPTVVQPATEAQFAEFFGVASKAFGYAPDADARKVHRVFLAHTEMVVARDEAGESTGTVAFLAGDQALPGGAIVSSDLVTWVSTLPTHRRQGVMTQLLAGRTSHWASGEVALAALWASEARIYRRFGFGPAATICYASADPGRLRDDPAMQQMADAANVVIRYVPHAEAAGTLPLVEATIARQRPGMVIRGAALWERWGSWAEGQEELDRTRSLVVATRDGEIVGWADYTRKYGDDELEETSTCRIHELFGAEPKVEAALWHFLASLDLVSEIRTPYAMPPDDVLFRIPDDHRAVRIMPRGLTDGLWIRICDVPRFLEERRYWNDGEIEVAVEDPLGTASGAWHLTADAGAGEVRSPTGNMPRIELRLDDLAALGFGDASATELQRAGRLHGSSEAIVAANRVFATPLRPGCSVFF